MFGGRRIGELQLRKQLLVVESGLNRLALAGELRNLRAATGWVGKAAHTGRRLQPFLLLLAPLAGFLAVRKARQPGGLFSRLLDALKLVRPALAAWKNIAGWRHERGGTDEPSI
jgi:hypothetical protein